MPRNDLKAYGSVIARIPQDLLDQVKQYASQHRCTVSELIREGLEMRLESGDVPGRSTGRSTDHGEEVIHEVIHTLSPMLLAQFQDTIRTTVTEGLHGHTSLPQPHTQGMPAVLPFETPLTAPTGKGSTEVLPLVPPLTPAPQLNEGTTTVIPLVPTTQQHAGGSTEVLPLVPTIPEPSEVLQEVIPPLPLTDSEGSTEVMPNTLRGIAEVLPHDTSAHVQEEEGHTEVLHDKADFDSTRFALGQLCVNGHAYGDTGQTLYRLPKYVCPQCDAARARERRARLKGQGRT